MAKQTSLKKNFIVLAIYRILMVIAPLIIAPYTSRVLGPELVGSYSYYFSLVTYFVIVTGFGFFDYGQRLIAERRDDKEEYSKTFYEITSAKYILGLAVSLVYAIINFSVGFISEEGGVLIFSIMYLNILAEMLDPAWFFMGLEKYNILTIVCFLSKALLIACIFIFVKSPEDFLNYIIVYSAIIVGFPLIMYPFLIPLLSKPKFKELNILRHFKDAFVFFVPVFSIILTTIVDKSMIQRITKDAFQNGYYEQATKLVTVVVNALAALKILMLSRISYLYSIGNFEEAKVKIIKALRTLFLLSIPAMFGVAIIAQNFVPLFFGADYEPAIYLIYALVPLILFTPLKLILQALYFSPKNKLWPYNITIVCGTILNICLNALFIYLWGAFGACIASSISEAATVIALMILARKDISFATYFKTSYKQWIASFIMAGLGFVLTFIAMPLLKDIPHYNFIAVIIEIASCAVLYLICVLLLKEEMTWQVLRLKRK